MKDTNQWLDGKDKKGKQGGRKPTQLKMYNLRNTEYTIRKILLVEPNICCIHNKFKTRKKKWDIGSECLLWGIYTILCKLYTLHSKVCLASPEIF
jgi:hypothetical protein